MMTVQSVTNATPTLFEKWKDQLSKTDWKVHSLVVLGYLLVGIGIVLACASPVIAFITHPMVGASAPALFIGCGAAAFEATKSHHLPSSQNPPKEIPLGLVNDKYNCWANATLQLLLHLPHFQHLRDQVKSASGWSGALAHSLNPNTGLFPIIDFCEKYHRKEQVNSQQIRLWLSKHNSIIKTSSSVQQDPIDLLRHFLNHAPSSSIIEHVITYQGSDVKEVRSERTHFNGLIDLPLYDLTGDEVASVPSLIRKYFRRFDPTTEGGIAVVKFFQDPPEGFCVSVPLATENLTKKVRPLKGAMELTLDPSEVGEEARYHPDGFILHQGSHRIDTGHYVAYFCKDGYWYRASDQHVQWVSVQEAQKKIMEASVIHYALTKEC